MSVIRLSLILSIVAILVHRSTACTIFILTDANYTLFYNNEDFVNPNTRIWFIPGRNEYYGCAFVGFDDGSAQGGINEHGLAFDWYAGKPDHYVPDAGLIPVKGNSSERMLETCRTVDEAIAFYQTYAEAGFAKATMLIADKTGTSVIIGSRNGKLYFDKSKESRSLGFGTDTFKRMYNRKAVVHPAFGAEILKACLATGQGGTKYSNAYNLRTGDITIYNFSPGAESTTFNLFTELEKGAHYYEIQQIDKQITAPVQPLLLNMHRLILFEFSPLSDQAPAVTSRVNKFIEDARNRRMKAEDYSESLWKELSASQEELEAELEEIGDLESMQLIRKKQDNKMIIYSYIIIFQKARALMQFTFDNQMRIHRISTLSGDTNE